MTMTAAIRPDRRVTILVDYDTCLYRGSVAKVVEVFEDGSVFVEHPARLTRVFFMSHEVEA